MLNNGLPKQRIPRVKKTPTWGKDTIDAIIKNSAFEGGQNSERLSRNEDFYLGNIDQADYKYVVNPFNSKKFADKFPAKIRSYNIIKPIVDLMLGEKAKRPRQLQVLCLNPDAIDMKRDAQLLTRLKALKQMFINSMNQAGMATGQEDKPIEAPVEIEAKFNSTYKDQRAVLGQQIYQYLEWFLNLNDKYQDAFKEWLINGSIYSFKEPAHNDVLYDIVPSSEIDYDRSGSLKYVEDGAWVVRKKRMTVSEIIDRFYDVLTEDQLDFLENPDSYQDTDLPSFRLDFLDNEGSITDNDRILNVYHAAWKAQKKIGILTYIDENGIIQQMEVSEEYVFDEANGDIDIDWFWVNEVYHGFRIDKNIHLPVEPFPTQRGKLDNPSVCKLPYNGIKTEQSVVESGIPYQLLYNIFHFRLELSIAKNKDKILLMEMNTIPKRHGWDADRFMYTADAAGFAFIDSTAENADGDKVNFNQWSVLDMSLSNYISAQFELLSAVKNEWEESMGISRQRKGNIMASDGRGNTERSIFQSSIMTEELFRRAEDWEMKEAAGLIETAKAAYKDGKKASYILGALGVQMLDIEQGDVEDMELGIAPVNDTMAIDNLNTLKSMALEFAQNGMSGSTVAELLESKSMSNIKQKLKEVEEAERQFQAAQEQAQQEAQLAAQQAQQEVVKEQREDEQLHESTENALDRDKDIAIKQMDIESKANDGNDSAIKERAQQLNENKFQADKSLKEKELNHRIDHDNKKLALEGKKIAKASTNNSKTN